MTSKGNHANSAVLESVGKKAIQIKNILFLGQHKWRPHFSENQLVAV